MTSKLKRDGIFVSCVSAEFEDKGAPYPGLRSRLDVYLRKANCRMIVQEVLPQTNVDIVEKLDTPIRERAAVLHLIGAIPGAVANEKAVAAYLKAVPDFLENQPELKDALGDFSGITYTQWEAYIALHHNVPLFIYATDDGMTDQSEHLRRLRLARKFPGENRITDPVDLFGQLIGDIHSIVASVPEFTRKISGTQLEKHAPKVLFGRETELAALDAAWAKESLNAFTLVAWGGAGKTSLVFHWVQTRFAAKGWPGVERYFDWSFYSQGTGESRQTSADLFINKALEFFGDSDPTKGGPHERGERLARLIRQHRSLLILDGIEPLQYPPNDPQAGRLKDPALETLLRELAADNPGLVVITTREHLTNVEGHATTEEQKLDKLAQEAAVSLLRHLQIVGTDEELHAAWKDAGGHALTLSLLGRFIADAYEDRDIRHYREVKFEAADQEHQGRSAFKVMIAYERWLKSGGPERQRELAVLRLTGLFDRPMAKSCLQALRNWKRPSFIRRLFDRRWSKFAATFGAIMVLTDVEWNIAVKRLSEVELLSVSPDAIDAHPLIREYFALQLQREQPEAFRAAHSRLFDYLCETTKPHHPDGLDGLAPLYEAVTHGCLARRQQEALYKVYVDRILRGAGSNGFYSTKKLGAIGADLAAVAAFFVPSSSVAWASRPGESSTGGTPEPLVALASRPFSPSTGETPVLLAEPDTGGTPVRRSGPWSQVSPNLTAADKAWLLSVAAFNLRALGRLTEALQPMRAGLEMAVRLKDWNNAARYASNLSELEVTLGRLPDAVTDARSSITHADQSGDAFQRMARRTTAADALHQSGQRAESGALFAEAERMWEKEYSQLMSSLGGFRYCDWLLAPAEQAAWQRLSRSTGVPPVESEHGRDAHATVLAEVERRASRYFANKWNWYSLLDIALDHLTLARVGLIRAILEAGPKSGPGIREGEAPAELQIRGVHGSAGASPSRNPTASNPSDRLEAWPANPTLDLPHVAAAVNGLRAAGQMDYLPLGLLTAALYHFVRGEPALAEQHLAEAQQIADRGPMPLYLADIHLHRARMFRDRDSLSEAAELIRDLAYGRRTAELADAEGVAKQWST